MITAFITMFMSIIDLLPESYLLALLYEYSDELEPVYTILGYVNWFIPFNYLIHIFNGWAVLMLGVLVLHHFYTKL